MWDDRVNLQMELGKHLLFRVFMIQMTEVDQRLVHCLVPRQGISILHRFSDNISILILHYNHLQREAEISDTAGAQNAKYIKVQISASQTDT